MRPSQLRKTRPEVVDRPTCSTAKIGKIEQGSVVQMIETFKLPWQEFERVRLELSLPPGRPTYLAFQR